MTKHTHVVRPMVASIVSVVTFLLGFAGTLAMIIFVVGVSFLPRSVNIPSVYVYAAFFWLVVGPLLILAGYNLWKMKKWAGQLAAIIYLFDLITAPFIFGIDIGYIFAGVMDIIILVLIAVAWKHLQNGLSLSSRRKIRSESDAK